MTRCAWCDEAGVVQALELAGIVCYCARHAIARARQVAEQRQTQGRKPGSTLLLRNDTDWFGILGELAFARRFDLPVRFKDEPLGDKGIDFITPGGTVDVKTGQVGYTDFFVPASNALRADLYVVARYGERQGVELAGWCRRATLQAAPIRSIKARRSSIITPTRIVRAEQLEAIPAIETVIRPPAIACSLPMLTADEIQW